MIMKLNRPRLEEDVSRFSVAAPPLVASDVSLSVYRGVRDRSGGVHSLGAVISRIRSGARGLDDKVASLRSQLAAGKQEAYDKEKISLPAVTFGGVFSRRTELQLHSGLMVLDFDKLGSSAVSALAEVFGALSVSVLVFISPSGRGIKVVIRLDPVPVDAMEHRDAFLAVERLFADAGVAVDTSGKDVTRLCFLSHDNDVSVNLEADAFAWQEASRALLLRSEQVSGAGQSEVSDVKVASDVKVRSSGDASQARRVASWEGEIDVSALDFISPDSDYDVWLAVGMACNTAGLSVSVWDAWSSGGTKYKAGECSYKWNSFSVSGRIGWGTVVYLAKQGGYKLARRKRLAPAVLQRAPDNDNGLALQQVEPVLLEEVRAVLGPEIKDALDWEAARLSLKMDTPLDRFPVLSLSGSRLVVLVGADTGAGKTRAVILNTQSLLYAGPHGALVDGAYEEALALGKVAFRWQGRRFGFAWLLEQCDIQSADISPDDREGMISTTLDVWDARERSGRKEKAQVLCPFADVADRVYESGLLPGGSLCIRCSLKDRCMEDGYLSQYEEASKSGQVYIALAEMQLVLDGDWHGMVGMLGGARIACIDDITPWHAMVRREISLKKLDRMLTSRSVSSFREKEHLFSFEPEVGAIFLELLLVALSDGSISFYRAVSGVINDFQEAGRWERVLEDLSQIPFYYSVQRDGLGGWLARCVRSGKEFLLKSNPGAGELHRRTFWGKEGKIHRRYLSHSQADAIGLFEYGEAAFPVISDVRTGWVASLATWLSEVGNPDNAPCGEVPDWDGAWEYYRVPFLNYEKTVILSATGSPAHFEKVLPDGTDFVSIGGQSLVWQEGCAVYQIETGRYTDASYFAKWEDNKGIKEARSRLEDVIQLVRALVREGKRVVIFGRKALYENESLAEVMGPVLALDTVEVLNYGEMVGRNDLASADVGILMLPDVSPVQLQLATRILYRGDDVALDFETRSEQDVRFGGFVYKGFPVYKDERVQEVYLSLVQHNLYQAAMRLRPMLYPDKHIVLLTSFPVPGLTDRKETVLCRWEDLLEADGNLSAVPDIVQARGVRDSTAEGHRESIINDASLSHQEAGTRLGLSARHVSRLRSEQGVVLDKETAREEGEVQVKKMAQEGVSKREIARRMGISRAKVDRILKTQS